VLADLYRAKPNPILGLICIAAFFVPLCISGAFFFWSERRRDHAKRHAAKRTP
jgi:hypothetical protein